MGRADDHRRPPPPPHIDAPEGFCRLCGAMVTNAHGATGQRWHPRCATLYNIASDPAYARSFVYLRDKGQCCDCPRQDPREGGAWEVDHGVPLRDAPRELRFWLPENLFTRCNPCHSAKTVRENAERRAATTPQVPS